MFLKVTMRKRNKEKLIAVEMMFWSRSYKKKAWKKHKQKNYFCGTDNQK